MSLAALSNTSEVFAANRAAGHVHLAVEARLGRTRRVTVREEGSLRVRFPHEGADPLEAITVNTAGGMTGGDHFSVRLDVGADAQLVFGTTAAEKVYRSHGPDTRIDVALNVGAGARLSWAPQETILFDRARLSRSIEIDLAEGARIAMAEAIVFGRSAMGETVEEGGFRDRWRVRQNGKLIFAENVAMNGALARQLAARASANGNVALATVLVAPVTDAGVEAVRSLQDQFRGEAGISAWNGIGVARLCAHDGAALRHDLALVLAALDVALPRLWSN